MNWNYDFIFDDVTDDVTSLFPLRSASNEYWNFCSAQDPCKFFVLLHTTLFVFQYKTITVVLNLCGAPPPREGRKFPGGARAYRKK